MSRPTKSDLPLAQLQTKAASLPDRMARRAGNMRSILLEKKIVNTNLLFGISAAASASARDEQIDLGR